MLDVLLSSSSPPLCFPSLLLCFFPLLPVPPHTFVFLSLCIKRIAPHLCRSPLAALYIQAVFFPGQTTPCVNSGQRSLLLLLGWERGFGGRVNHCISHRCSYQCWGWEQLRLFLCFFLPRCFKDTHCASFFLPSLSVS